RLQPRRLSEPLARLLATAFDEHLAAPADAGFVEGQLVAVERGLEALKAFVHDLARDLAVHRRSRRAGAGRVLEAERLRVADRIDQPQCFLELRLGFAGEADDE